MKQATALQAVSILVLIISCTITIANCAPTWSCPPLPQAPPATRANQLHPSNVKVIAALGDSITAGFAMHNYPLEYRSDVFDIGGNPNATTLATILKHYSPDIVGAPNDDPLPLDVVPKNKTEYLKHHHKKVGLNAGISEAKANGVPQQVDYIVWAMKNKYKIDYNNDWKVITLLIGANDLCVVCDGRDASKPVEWGKTIDSIVQQVHQQIPRVYMNLVSMFNISYVYRAWHDAKSPYCKDIHTFVDECPCLSRHGESGRQQMDNATKHYNLQLKQIAAKYQAMNDPNFWVVYQPSNEDNIIPSTKFLSDLDCFHPNAIADELLATSLWNAMLTPAASKHRAILGRPLQCPTSSSILQ